MLKDALLIKRALGWATNNDNSTVWKTNIALLINASLQSTRPAPTRRITRSVICISDTRTYRYRRICTISWAGWLCWKTRQHA